MGVQCFAQDYRNKHKNLSQGSIASLSSYVTHQPLRYQPLSLPIDDGAKDIKNALPWYLFGHDIKANKVK